MKVIFAHDHRFIESGGTIWSESQFESALWSRYLVHFDAVTVAARSGIMPVGKKAEQLELSSAPFVSFELFANLSSPRELILRGLAERRRMRALVGSHDAVIARLPSEIGLLAIAEAISAGRPWAVEVAGCPWDALWNYGNILGRVYAPFAWWRMRQVVKHADHALYVTREFLQHRYPSHAGNQVFASNVILASISPRTLQERLERIGGLSRRPLRLGLIGTLRGRFKGIQTLLAALAQARDRLPLLKLHVLGGGDAAPWRAEAQRLAVGDLVAFDGTLPGGEPIMQWLDNIDLYLQPSLQEGLPRALIEAMSRACPALASTAAGIPELLAPEDLFRPGNADGLAALLVRRAGDKEWMAKRARSNWEAAHEYRAELLDVRRSAFWGTFRAAADFTAQRDQRGV